MNLWRICKKRRAPTAFDGEGARLYPGRWNQKGVPVVYCASSLSLATLETFVHLDPEDLPVDLVSIQVIVPDDVINAAERIAVASLPSDWRNSPGPQSLQEMGSEWARSGRTAALFAPSAVVPGEWNVLLNPSHPQIGKLAPMAPEPFVFDPRMRK